MRIRTVPLLLVLLGFSTPSSAQLILPDKPVKRASPGKATAGARKQLELPETGGTLAERMLGRKPGEPPPEGGSPADDGSLEPSETEPGALDLPSNPVRPHATGSAPAIGAPAAGFVGAAPLENLPTGEAAAADFVLRELRRVTLLDDPFVEQAAEELVGLREWGLDVSRRSLFEDHPATIVATAQALLEGGNENDRQLVVRRLNGRLPPTVCSTLLETWVRHDPVAADPTTLCSLLDHRQVTMRAAAQRELMEQLSPALLQPLVTTLESRRTDTRLRVLDIVEDIDHPASREIFLSRLRDPSAQVAMRAVRSLVAIDDEGLELELLREAFDQPWILRDGAYALIALMEKEDAYSKTLIGEQHIDLLMNGLTSSDPFVSGVSAAVLAGIGYRSERAEDTSWLDREVPHYLVRAISGVEFHNDFSSLQEIGQRRLALISGQSFGSNGPAWLSWWKVTAPEFKARTATLPYSVELVPTLRVRWVSTGDTNESFDLMGPRASQAALVGPAQVPSMAEDAEPFLLTPEQARSLFDQLSREGVFGVERVPGQRGIPSGAFRQIDIEIGGRTKSFRFASDASEPWFEKIATSLKTLRDRNRWQRYYDGAHFPTRESLWIDQATWWDEQHPELERARRLKSLVFDALETKPVEERAEGIGELQRLYDELPDVREDADFDELVTLLESETFLGSRVRALLNLAAVHVAAAETNPSEPLVRLSTLLVDQFGERSDAELATVLRAGGRDAVRWAAGDPRPTLRRVSAVQLAVQPEEADLALLRQLLTDREIDVQVAATRQLGALPGADFRAELMVRASSEVEAVRIAALETLGAAGGAGAMDSLVIALSDPSAAVRTAGAHGLAALGDPSAAPLLLAQLSQGVGAPVHEPARIGLLDLGEAAWSDLLRAVNTPGHPARRDAALILGAQGVPESAPVLMRILTEDPSDPLVAWELAILTGADLRDLGSPAEGWWDWWEGVVHDDSLAWFVAGLQREKLRAPALEDLRDAGTRTGALALVDLMPDAPEHLAERARRELSRLVGQDVPTIPAPGTGRDVWASEVRDRIEETWQ